VQQLWPRRDLAAAELSHPWTIISIESLDITAADRRDPLNRRESFMKRTRVALGTAVVTSALALTACGGGSSSDPLATAKSTPAASDTIVVGSANFPENALLAEIYAGALSAKGVKVTKKLNIGSRETYIPGLQDGSIDLIPEYSGVLLQYFDKTATAVSSDDVFAALKTAVPATLTVLDQSTAEDKDAIVVTKATATKYNLTSIGDLKPVEKSITLGGPPEYKTRPTGIPGLKKLYDLDFKSFKSLDAGGPLTVTALKKGQIQAGDIFTTDPNIAAEGWVALQDPKNLFAAQNVLPLINKAKASAAVTADLNAVSAKLTTPVLAGLVKEVVLDKKDPEAVAKEFLTTNSLG
jgi:osmoprotectant transport system substrate-binding protein